jgi:hypothetical protein
VCTFKRVRLRFRVRVRDRVRVRVRSRVRVTITHCCKIDYQCSKFMDGYISRYAHTVAKGDSAGLLVQIMRDVISFSHSVLFELDCLPPVDSR